MNVYISAVTVSYSSIPWILILSILTTAIGRKKTHTIVSMSCVIGFSILYFSKTINQMFISQIFQGASIASHLTASIVILTEYTSSKNRTMFLPLKSATFFWGILAANTIGTFFRWNNIAIVGVLCSVYNLVSVTIWPESPYWLASKGKFDECSKSHKWLKGTDAESLKELENLVKSFESKIFVKKNYIRDAIKVIFSWAFLKPILLSCLLICLYAFSGKLVCTVYALDILKKITNDMTTSYKGMLILDGVTVVSMYLGCFLSKILKRRTMLISFSSVGIMFLFSLSGYLYLVKLSLVKESSHVSIALLAGYSVAISCGPMIMATSIIGELLPLESKSLFMCINAFIFKSILSTFLKISPYFFKTFDMHGTFLLYGILSIVFLVLIYFLMPETKNQTLLEIQESLNGTTHQSLRESRKLMPNLVS